MKKFPENNIEKYWQEKERETGEEITGKGMCEYVEGFPGMKEKTWGLLYYTKKSFYFQTFPKKSLFTSLMGNGQKKDLAKRMSFQISWKEVKDMSLPAQRNIFFSFLSPPDYRVYITYQIESRQEMLILAMYSRKNRDQFIDYYHQYVK